MNAFQRCPSTAECVPLYLPQQLYLRPIARITISLQLPNLNKLGKTISHWEIMDKIRELARPDEFTILKVCKTTVEFIRFEGEIDKTSRMDRLIDKLHNKMIKLKDFGELMRLKAAPYHSDFPNRRMWDGFFSDARDMDEMKPGERPDTVHISNLPTKWFIPYHMSNEEDAIPSEKIFFRVFEKFGSIRYVDIPLADPYRKKMKDHISGIKYASIDKTDFFEGYVQFKDYIGFTKAMDALRDMKLVHKSDDGDFEVDIKVYFDKSKHLSDASIRRREIVRDRLVKKAREQEEKDKKALEDKKKQENIERQREVDLQTQKEIRRRVREEKRKVKILKNLEISGSDEITEKIAREEKKLLKVQRKLEAIRLIEELFRRVKDKLQENVQLYDRIPNPSQNELKRYKNTSELAVLTQREKLHNVLKGRVMLKTILSHGPKTKQFSTSSSDSELSDSSNKKIHKKLLPINNTPHPSDLMMERPNHSWYGYVPFGSDPYQHFVGPTNVPPLYPEYGYGYMPPRGRGARGFLNRAGPSRGVQYHQRGRGRGGFNPRMRGIQTRHYAPELEEEYKKYFEKFLSEHRRSRSRSTSRRRSYSRSRSRSRSRRSYRSRSRSYSRSKSRSRSRRRRSRSSTPRRSKRRSRSGHRSEERSTRRDRSDERSSRRDRSGEKSSRRGRGSGSKDRSRSKDRSPRRNRSNERNCTPNGDPRQHKSAERRTPLRRSRGRSSESRQMKSISRERETEQRQRSRSKEKSAHKSDENGTTRRSRSWSLPREEERGKRSSWSKSPEIKR